ncbi:hypothetical protein ACHAXS_011124 [Conticribra weissflogii]
MAIHSPQQRTLATINRRRRTCAGIVSSFLRKPSACLVLFVSVMNNNHSNQSSLRPRMTSSLLPLGITFHSFADAATTTAPRPRSSREDRDNRQSFYDNDDEHDHDYSQHGQYVYSSATVDGGDIEGNYSLSAMFKTDKPRDVLEGIKAAISNTLRGGLYGVGAFLGSPIAGVAKDGKLGLLKGFITGALLGMALPLTGVVIGAGQVIRGLISTPAAIVDGFYRCKVWNETDYRWEEYRLDDEAEEIRSALEAEEQRKKRQSSASGGAAAYSKEYVSLKKVKTTEYYDLLGVPPNASSSAIRSAYRKRARVVHPDKNPNDPSAERKFRKLSAAYQTLSDPTKRKRYDTSGIGADQSEMDKGASAMLDPYVFFAVLFASEQVEPYIGELGGTKSYETWEDLKSALGWKESNLKRRKRQVDIALHLRSRVADYVEGYLELSAFKESCWDEAVNIANGGSYGATFLLAIGPALVVESDSFLGYRASVLGSWRGPVSNAKRNALFFRRKLAFTKALLRTLRESLKAIYESADFVQDANPDIVTGRSRIKKPEKVVFSDKELLKDNLSNTIPTILDMAWSLNYIDITNTLSAACGKLFYDANVSSWEERLRRAEAVHILGSQFWLVGLEVTGGNTTRAENVEDIKNRASAAFMESLKKGMENDEPET